jgi:hypothetical protein
MSEKLKQSLLPKQGSQWLELVRDQVGSLRFGTVQIVVHNSQVVQVERTERIRFGRPDGESGNIAQ